MTSESANSLPPWAEFVDQILLAAEERRRSAIRSLRAFVEEVNPVISDRSRRKSIVESRLRLAEARVASRMAFRRNVVAAVVKLTAKTED